MCSLSEISIVVTQTCLLTSLNHLLLISAERYVAIKHPFAYENHITEGRIILASGLAWAVANLLRIGKLLETLGDIATIIAVSITVTLFLIVIVDFNVAVYKEVRRNEKQVAANQVS